MRLFTRRPTAPASTRTGTRLAETEQARCQSYAPGHQMHYIHQGQALRSPSTPTRDVVVDGDMVVVLLADGTVHDFRHHDPDRLTEVLGLFPATRVLYTRFHALRVGPYWFNLAPAAFEPCDVGSGP